MKAEAAVSFILGQRLKERYLAQEFEQADARDAKMVGTAAKARIMQYVLPRSVPFVVRPSNDSSLRRITALLTGSLSMAKGGC